MLLEFFFSIRISADPKYGPRLPHHGSGSRTGDVLELADAHWNAHPRKNSDIADTSVLALVCPLSDEFPQLPPSILTASKCQTLVWEAARRRNPGQLSHNPTGTSSEKSNSATRALPCQSRQLLKTKTHLEPCVISA